MEEGAYIIYSILSLLTIYSRSRIIFFLVQARGKEIGVEWEEIDDSKCVQFSNDYSGLFVCVCEIVFLQKFSVAKLCAKVKEGEVPSNQFFEVTFPFFFFFSGTALADLRYTLFSSSNNEVSYLLDEYYKRKFIRNTWNEDVGMMKH